MSSKSENGKNSLVVWMKGRPILSIMLLFFTSIFLGVVLGSSEPTELEIIPEYEVIKSIEVYNNGGLLLDILIPTFSKDTSQGDMQSVSNRIQQLENAKEVNIYCSREAREANYSEKYRVDNPNSVAELEKCFLGTFKY